MAYDRESLHARSAGRARAVVGCLLFRNALFSDSMAAFRRYVRCAALCCSIQILKMAAQGTGAPAAEAKEGPRRPLNYAELSKDSLRAVTMENGLQQSAIYWETGHRTWLPFWASFTQKFTWKIIDDQVEPRTYRR